MRKVITAIFILAIASIFSAWPIGDCHALKGFEVGARGFYWDTSLDATMQTNNDPEIDLKSDLNIGDEAFGSGEVFLRWGRNHFTLAYTSVSNSGSAANGVIFNGIPFPGPVDSDYDYDQIDFIYQYDLIKYNPVIANFNLGILLQVKYVDGFAEVRGDVPIIGFRVEREDFSAPIPMIGLGAGVGIVNDLVVLEGRVAGLEYSGDRAIDGQALIGVRPFPFLKIFGGYKVFDLEVDEDDFKVDYTIDGPFAGVQLSF
jgi:hypothetical protein